MPGCDRFYRDYGSGAITSIMFRPVSILKQSDGNQVASDMPRQGPSAQGATPSLTRTESDQRRALLGLLKDALDARRVSSVLVGRRTLVLRSEQGQERPGAGTEVARPAYPQLYVFAAAGTDVHIVTTDGDAYLFGGGRSVPVADPGDAARAYTGWARRQVSSVSRARSA